MYTRMHVEPSNRNLRKHKLKSKSTNFHTDFFFKIVFALVVAAVGRCVVVILPFFSFLVERVCWHRRTDCA